MTDEILSTGDRFKYRLSPSYNGALNDQQNDKEFIVKKWLLLLDIAFSLAIATSVQAIDKVAVVNMDYLFQQIAQKVDVSRTLENEFRDRANELQRIEDDLQSKIYRLQYDSSILNTNDRNELEKDVIFHRQAFSQKAKAFEQDHQRRSNEERNKLIKHIQKTVKSVATSQHVDLVIDSNVIAFNNSDIKDITADVLNGLNNNNELNSTG